MKILYITPGCFDKGGISRYNRYQITACRELFGTDQVKVFSLLGPSDNDFEDPFSVEWHGTGANGKSKLALVLRVIKTALQWKPDLILCAHVNLSGLAYLACGLCRAGTILNAYGLEIWSPLSRDASWGLKKVKYIISDCHNTADWLVNHGIRKRDRIRVIWDCIDLDKFKPQSPAPSALQKYQIPDPQRYFNVLSLGRLSLPDALYKGYDRLITVFASLAQEYDQVRLIIAGKGNYIDHLKEMVKEKKIADKVLFTGSVGEEDMASVYNSCSIFSLITEAGEGKGEGIPLTPLEAMACGKPILVGNQDGSREAVIGGNGFAMDPFNLEEHKRIIIQYIQNSGLLHVHSEEALAVAHAYFSYDHFKQKHEQFFNDIRKN
jgi:phosphatidylinositol alpha-1,6-mannosyltransferase